MFLNLQKNLHYSVIGNKKNCLNQNELEVIFTNISNSDTSTIYNISPFYERILLTYLYLYSDLGLIPNHQHNEIVSMPHTLTNCLSLITHCTELYYFKNDIETIYRDIIVKEVILNQEFYLKEILPILTIKSSNFCSNDVIKIKSNIIKMQKMITNIVRSIIILINQTPKANELFKDKERVK